MSTQLSLPTTQRMATQPISQAERRAKQKSLLIAAQTLALFDSDLADRLPTAGFQPVDKEFGLSLARTPWERWTPKIINAARLMMAKYSPQLGYSTLDIPPCPAEEVAQPKPQAAVPQQPHQQIPGMIEEIGGAWLIRFSRNPGEDVTKQLVEIGAHWLKSKFAWKLPHNTLLAAEIAETLQRCGVRTPRIGFFEELRQMGAKTLEMEKRSSVIDSDFVIEGLGAELYPYQRGGVAYAYDSKRTFIADAMGLGKTPQALATLKKAKAFPAVVVCPANLTLNWAREIMRWLPGAYVSLLTGQRKYWSGMNGDIMVTTYAQFQKWAGSMEPDSTKFQRGKKPPLKFVPGPLCERPIRALILDESHYVKEKKAQRTQVVLGFIEHCPTLEYRLLLTGTPMLNRPKELITQLEVLGRLQEFGGWHEFVKKYCSGYQDRFGWKVDGHGSAAALQELNSKLRRLCFVRREKKDVLKELPPKIRNVVPLEISNRKEYDEAEADVAAWCAKRAIEDEEFLRSIAELPEEARRRAIAERKNSQYEKTRQIEQLARIGVLQQICAKGKVDGVTEWAENVMDSGEKLIMYAVHIDVQHALLAAIGAKYPCAKIFAGDDALTCSEPFQKDERIRGIICSLGAANTGWNGNRSTNVAFAEFGWTPSIHDQGEDRAYGRVDKGLEQNISITSWWLAGQDTIDLDTIELIEGKRKVVTAASSGQLLPESENIAKDLAKRLADKGRRLL